MSKEQRERFEKQIAQEKRIEELEAQIEKIKCPWNCKRFGDCIYSICPCGKWELREIKENE